MKTNWNKRSIFLIMVIIISILFIGCSKEKNSNNNALKSIGIDSIQNDVLAVIINNPSTINLDKITDLKTFEFDSESKETLLIIPRYNKMNVEIRTLSWENDALKDDEVVYKEEYTKDGFGLLLKAHRVEGIPILKIYIEGDGIKGEYIITYNGKDGTPEIEYIKKINSN